MAAFKVVQKIASVNGNATSGSIALKSGYLRVTPAGGDAFVEVGTNPTATDDSSIYVPQKTSLVLKRVLLLVKQHQLQMHLQQLNLVFHLEQKLHLLLVVLSK